ncbi:MAG: DUF2934 domain-containing protein [Leptolyngbya sp. PLA2]|nr:DUF2934 domain-containing protein [Leptolyngbya sp.]MCE7970625.1 DUF2934 domain-containing protein [Leptolyngbya sp. PL-A2]MCQ3939779.1 hypothetical protein [cyanobacterium CYA1]MDL1903476.1 DUF2934 domain-containing protein [Synechococcales cyanobacterium CNB]
MARRSHQAEGSTTRSATVEFGTVREALAELNSLRHTEAPRRRTLGRRPMLDLSVPAATQPANSGSNQGPPVQPTTEQVRRRAYELWIARGCRDGHDLDDWLDAERELRGQP